MNISGSTVNVGLNPRKNGEGQSLQPIPLSTAITTKIMQL